MGCCYSLPFISSSRNNKNYYYLPIYRPVYKREHTIALENLCTYYK